MGLVRRQARAARAYWAELVKALVVREPGQVRGRMARVLVPGDRRMRMVVVLLGR